MTSEEINALGVFKRKTVRKIYGPIQEESRASEPGTGYIIRSRHCKIYKITQIKIVWIY
jgi:hypothetical protein